VCHKEGHTIRNCFKYFSCLKNKGGQDRNHKQSKDFKHKKKAHAMWSANSDENRVEDSGTESGEEQILNLALMTIIDEKSSPIDIDAIIASKNITDLVTIKDLRSVTDMKNMEMQSKEQSEDSAQSVSSFTIKVNLNFNDETGGTLDDEIMRILVMQVFFLSENLIIENKSRLETQVNKTKIVLSKKMVIINYI
jgi:hypothetical protein